MSRLTWMAAVLVLPFAMAGCLAVTVVGTAGGLATKAVSVAAKTTVVVVKATGKTAWILFADDDKLSEEAIDEMSRLSAPGMVTLVGVASESIVRVRWERGMTLGSACAAAGLEMGDHAVALVRGGRLAYESSGRSRTSIGIEPGDVARLGR